MLYKLIEEQTESAKSEAMYTGLGFQVSSKCFAAQADQYNVATLIVRLQFPIAH